MNRKGRADDPDGTFDLSDGFWGRLVVPARATAPGLARRRHRAAAGTRPQRAPALNGQRWGNRDRRAGAALRRRRTDARGVPRATCGPRAEPLTPQPPVHGLTPAARRSSV